MNNTQNVIDVLNSLQNAIKKRMEGNVLSFQHMNFIELVDLMADADIRFTKKEEKEQSTITVTGSSKEEKLDMRGLNDIKEEHIISNKETQRQLNLFGSIGGEKDDDKGTNGK